MSTPTATLPIKTDNNTIDQSDINDPIVQDVLNEFRDELSSSKKKDEYKHVNMANSQQQQQPSYQQLQQQSHQPLQQQHHQQPYQQPHQQQYPQGPQGPQVPPNSNLSQYQYPKQNQMYSDSFPYFNIDFELIKKNLIIVIIALLIYNTGLINILYEKAPDYLQDNLLPFDIYIRSVTYFISLYILSSFEYL